MIEKKIILLLFVFFAALCFNATPARADLFGFNYGNLSSSYDAGTNEFQSTYWSQTSGDLYRNIAPGGTASFDPGSWLLGPEDLRVQMTISNITADTADGQGTLTLIDVDGDVLTTNVSGQWEKIDLVFFSLGAFSGTLSNVNYNPASNTFDGHSGDSVSLEFGTSQPWQGAFVELTTNVNWFDEGSYSDAHGGSMEGVIVAVPAPAAVMLGLFGLSIVGIKLRKFA